jgi:hypothetical protein
MLAMQPGGGRRSDPSFFLGCIVSRRLEEREKNKNTQLDLCRRSLLLARVCSMSHGAV